MTRRRFIQSSIVVGLGTPALAALHSENLNEAADILARSAHEDQITSAVLHVVQRENSFTRAFGKAQNENAMFLLGSISKPICMTALMTLFDRGEFKLSDPLKKFIPEFKGDRRDEITIEHLLTHTSGLPDQLPNNNELRAQHASLPEFVENAVRISPQFAPGSNYQYSSMGILLAAHIAEIISRSGILTLVDRAVFQPLKMNHSAQGLGHFKIEDMVRVQTEHAAPESGGGDRKAMEWDWNSSYWRKLGAPWGGTHASAPDLVKFLSEFLNESGACVKAATARMMITNHNPPAMTPRGLGFVVGATLAKGSSEKTFGHTGSTGTIAWADPATHTICVVLTSLPAQATHPHPRDLASFAVATAAAN